MQITHEQARHLIQLNTDKALNRQKSAELSAHLDGCRECQAYASEMEEVESLLSPLMKRQWDLQPAPLSMAFLIQSKTSLINASALLAIRRAAVGLVVAAFFFSAWQFMRSESPISTGPTTGVLPAPTPSAHSTNTQVNLEGCELIAYTVTESDTLASLAEQFSISEEEIMAVNELRIGAIQPDMELVIPACTSTPTGTVHPATLTASQTYTPVRHPITLTPGPSG